MTKEQGEQILRQHGYDSPIYWKDEPGTINAEHSHLEDIGIVVVSGLIDVIQYSITDTHKEGDFYELKANLPHHSVIGNEGCEYLVGKK